MPTGSGPSLYPTLADVKYRPNGGGLSTSSYATAPTFGGAGLGGFVVDDREVFFKTQIKLPADVDPSTFSFQAAGLADDNFIGTGVNSGSVNPLSGSITTVKGFTGLGAEDTLFVSILNTDGIYNNPQPDSPGTLSFTIQSTTSSNSQCNKLTQFTEVNVGTKDPIKGVGDPGATITLSSGVTCANAPVIAAADGTWTCTPTDPIPSTPLTATPTYSRTVTGAPMPGRPAQSPSFDPSVPSPLGLPPIVCTANPTSATGATPVTVTCTGVPTGTAVTLPGGMTCTPAVASPTDTVTCTGGTASGVGSNPPATFTKGGTSIKAPVPFTLIPTCTANPASASGSTIVTTTCTDVSDGMVINVPGSTCTPSPFTGAPTGSVVCTGQAKDVGNNPPVSVTAAPGTPATNVVAGLPALAVPFTLLPPMTCSASPSGATGNTPVTITCINVPTGVTLDLPGTTCSPSPVTAAPSGSVVCTGGKASTLGSDPSVNASGGGLAAGTHLIAPFFYNIPSLSPLGLLLLAGLMLGIAGAKIRGVRRL